MSTISVYLSPDLRAFVNEQVASQGYGTSGDYVRELIRRDRDRATLRNLLLAGAASEPTGRADAAWFRRLRRRVRGLTD